MRFLHILHDWQDMDRKYRQETRPYQNQGFVKTIYFRVEQCSKCGKKRKVIYNTWIHKPENDPDPNSEHTVDHGAIISIPFDYEPFEEN